jgi:hypothetical protein
VPGTDVSGFVVDEAEVVFRGTRGECRAADEFVAQPEKAAHPEEKR